MISEIKKKFINEIDDFEIYMAIKSCVQAVIYGNLSTLKEYYPSISTFPPAYKKFLPIRFVKKECGLKIVHLDQEKIEEILSKYSINRNEAESALLFENSILPKGISIDLTCYKLFKCLSKKLIKKSILDSEYCYIHLGKCKCSDIEDNGSPKDTLKALQEKILTDKQIAKYIDENPIKAETKKFGEPQSKYRNGAYGLHGMEFDQWRK